METGKNLRNWVVTPEQGTDVKSTSMLKPGAHRTSAENSKNKTEQYTTSGGVPKDKLGAQNTNS